jgi:hypothetical protein
MKDKVFQGCLVILCGISLLLLSCAQPQQKAEPVSAGPSIEGTYQLVSRGLPDGTVQTPPNIMGLLTFTKEHRNFNVYWTDAKGKPLSISGISTYRLTPTEYTEKSLYFMFNDEIHAKGISYDLAGPSGTSPVTIVNGRIEFKMPNYNEPSVVFEGNYLTATREGEFVDHWEKVQ